MKLFRWVALMGLALVAAGCKTPCKSCGGDAGTSAHASPIAAEEMGGKCANGSCSVASDKMASEPAGGCANGKCSRSGASVP